MRPISVEKRELIVAAKQRGEKESDILKWVKGISRSVITTVWRQFKATGTIEPKKYKGRISTITAETDDRIRRTINETPDITLLELIDKLSLSLSESGLSRHIKKMGLTYKKRHSTQMAKSVKTLLPRERNGKISN